MNVLLCGANGFIGRHLYDALTAAGHHVIRGVRSPVTSADIQINYARDLTAETWSARLRGIDAVVNAVGILCEGGGATFDAIHRDAPVALFRACERVGVGRVIQISALSGAGDGKELTPYMRTKREADAHLMQSDLDWIVLRPSLVVGIDGDSSRFFRMLASLPVVGLPGRGEQRLQPVHISDLCDAVVRCLSADAPSKRVIDIAGPEPMTYRAMLSAYRAAMGLAAPLWLPVPMPAMRIAAAAASRLPQRVFSPDTLRMLEEGNVADPAALTRLLGRPPIGVAQWFAGLPPAMLRSEALSAWLLPLFRIALAALWIFTGIVSLGLYPIADSLALLSQVGLHGAAAQAALYGAALLDCGLGVATLLAPSRNLWRLQIALIAAYTLIITVFLPSYWLHPFGPVSKNIPILALLIALYASESR